MTREELLDRLHDAISAMDDDDLAELVTDLEELRAVNEATDAP